MIRSNALLAGLAGAFVFAAPALAQDATDAAPTPAEQTDTQPSSLTLTPGTTVKSKDGTELGKLVGVQAGATGQELTVRGADGQVRPVPVTGIEASGMDISVDATLSDFQSSTALESSDATPDTTAADAPPADTPPTLPTDDTPDAQDEVSEPEA